MLQSLKHRYPALGSRDYRYYLFGWLLSNTGTQMQVVAINWQVYQLTHSPFSLAILGASRIIPVVIFSLIGGTLVDAHNRKKILFLTQILQAFVSCALAYITIRGLATPMILYSLNALLIALYCIDAPARSAFAPNLVAREHYGNAVSLNVIGYNVSTVAGPALAGFLIAAWGVGSIYALDALSFIILFVTLYLVKASGAIEGIPTKPSLKAIGEGLAFVRNNTMIWSTMLLDFFSTFFGEASVLLPIFATDILHVGPEFLGILYAAPFIGASCIGLVASYIGKPWHTGKALIAAICVYAFGTIVFGISKNYYLSIVALTIVGAGDGLSAIIRNIIRQMSTPDSIRGRMTSINMIFYTGGPRLGEVEAGLVAGLLGAPFTVVLGGVGTILVAVIMAKTIPVLLKYKEI
jgi:MFS family permease